MMITENGLGWLGVDFVHMGLRGSKGKKAVSYISYQKNESFWQIKRRTSNNSGSDVLSLETSTVCIAQLHPATQKPDES